MTYPSAEEIRKAIAASANLDANDDGTYTAHSRGGAEFLVEIKVSDVTGA